MTPIILTEGERAADAIAATGRLAAATTCGANATPSETVLETLRPYAVYLWPDNDDVGRDHMAAIAKRLHVMGVRAHVIAWPGAPAGGDAADYWELDENLPELLANAKEWKPVLFQGRRLQVVGVGRIEPPPRPPDILEGVIPALTYTSLVADGGTGKSMLATAICCASTVGASMLAGLDVQPAKWLYLDFEDSEATFADRTRRIFRGLGIPEPWPDIPWCNVDCLLKDGADDIAEAVEQLGVDGLVVDTVGPAQGPAEKSAEGATLAMYDAMRPFRGKKTVIFLDHLPKPPSDGKGKSGPARAIGSVYKGNEVRNSWEMRRLRADNLCGWPAVSLGLYHAKSNHGPLQAPLGLRLTWAGEELWLQQEPIYEKEAA